jgi:hypothetical protein
MRGSFLFSLKGSFTASLRWRLESRFHIFIPTESARILAGDEESLLLW